MIYLAVAHEAGLCKIGYAVNADRRLAMLRTACPFDLVLHSTREGGLDLEAAVHRAASAHRVKREWFNFNSAVVGAFAETLLPEGSPKDRVDQSGKIDWNDGRTLKVAIAKAGFTTASFAEAAGVSKAQLHRLIAGDFKPRFETDRKIRSVLTEGRSS